MTDTYIYGLIDPRDDCLRYIGKANNPKKRLRDHLKCYDGEITHKSNWIKNLLSAGLKPELVILEECPEYKWERVERIWIANARAMDLDLVNMSDGGDGVTATEEVRHKRSVAMMGHTVSEESRRKTAEANRGNTYGRINKGRIVSEETKHKMSESQRGNTYFKGHRHTEEARHKMSEASKGNTSAKGYHHTEEARHKMSEAKLHMSEDTKRRMSDSQRKRWSQIHRRLP